MNKGSKAGNLAYDKGRELTSLFLQLAGVGRGPATLYCGRSPFYWGAGPLRARTSRLIRKSSDAATRQAPVIVNSSFVAWASTQTMKMIPATGIRLAPRNLKGAPSLRTSRRFNSSAARQQRM